MDFKEITAAKIANLCKNREITCGEVTTSTLDKIESSNKTTNAFITILREQALERARVLDQLSDSEREKMPLFGVPIAIKDNICTKGIKTTCASKMLEKFIPPYNATVIDALNEAGAIIVGKTNLDEFAMGSSTENSFFGLTRNPHNSDYIPGGSSGGSAAAVGSAVVPVALGSDTGGSIRQPASHCGIVGVKPTYGRVSRYGLVAFASSLDQIGPMGQTTEDCARVLEVISKPDKRDSTCASRPFTVDKSIFSQDLKGIRVGLPKEYFGDGLDESVRKNIMAVVDAMKDAGAQTVDISLANVQHAIATYYIICTAEASSNLARYDGVKYGFRANDEKSLISMYNETRREGFGSEVKRRIMLGTYVLSSGYYDAYYLKAAKVRTLISQDFTNAFSKCDFIISPVTPSPAFKIGEKTADPLQMYLTDIYTVSANLAGIPGLSVPCGMCNNLPIGVQFMGPNWREDLLFKAAYFTECLTKKVSS